MSPSTAILQSLSQPVLIGLKVLLDVALEVPLESVFRRLFDPGSSSLVKRAFRKAVDETIRGYPHLRAIDFDSWLKRGPVQSAFRHTLENPLLELDAATVTAMLKPTVYTSNQPRVNMSVLVSELCLNFLMELYRNEKTRQRYLAIVQHMQGRKIDDILTTLDRILAAQEASPAPRAVSAAPATPTASALSEALRRPGGAPLLLVGGTLGAQTAATTRAALKRLPSSTVVVECDLGAVVPAMWLAGIHAWTVPILRALASSLDAAPVFESTWKRFQAAAAAASRMKSLQDHSGCDNSFLGLLARGEESGGRAGPTREHRNLLRELVRDTGDYELLLRPLDSLVMALKREFAARGHDVLLHLSAASAVPDLALACLLRSLLHPAPDGGVVRAVVSIEDSPGHLHARLVPGSELFPVHPEDAVSLRQRVLQGLRVEAPREIVISTEVSDQLVSYESAELVEFLERRPALLRLVVSAHAQLSPPEGVAYRLACLAMAYDATPRLLRALLPAPPLLHASAAAELATGPDGSRQLPIGVAAAILAATPPAVFQSTAEAVGAHLASTAHEQDASSAALRRHRLAAAYHRVLQHGEEADIDRWLLDHYRLRFASCLDLHAALARLRGLNGISDALRDAIGLRLGIVELIEQGMCHEPAVPRYFESLAATWRNDDPRYAAVAFYQVAQLAFAAGALDRALPAVELAATLDQRSFAAHSLWGLVLHRLAESTAKSDAGKARELDELAEEALTVAIGLSEEYEFAYYNLGVLMERRAERETERMESLARSAEEHDDAGSSTRELAECEAKAAGYYASAAHYYERAIRLDPVFSEALHNLCNVMIATSRFWDAARIAEHARRIAPELTFRLHFALATALLGAGDLEAAEKMLKDLYYDHRSEGKVAYNLAIVFALAAKWENARQWARTAQTLAENAGDRDLAELAREVGRAAREKEPLAGLNDSRARAEPPALDGLFDFLESRGYPEKWNPLLRSVQRMNGPASSAPPRKEREVPAPRLARKRKRPIRVARYPSWGGG